MNHIFTFITEWSIIKTWQKIISLFHNNAIIMVTGIHYYYGMDGKWYILLQSSSLTVSISVWKTIWNSKWKLHDHWSPNALNALIHLSTDILHNSYCRFELTVNLVGKHSWRHMITPGPINESHWPRNTCIIQTVTPHSLRHASICIAEPPIAVILLGPSQWYMALKKLLADYDTAHLSSNEFICQHTHASRFIMLIMKC